MKTQRFHFLSMIGLGALMLCSPVAVLAGPQIQAGPYRIEVTSQTGVIPTTGRVKLLYKVTDCSGRPIEGVTLRSLTKMHGMNMGEREEMAIPVAGLPGVYAAHASFAMEGGYEDSLNIDGPLGSTTAKISLSTGQNTTDPAGSSSTGTGSFSVASLWPWLAALGAGALLVIVMVRMKQTGQSLSVRGIANRSVIGGLILLGVILWAAVYAVSHFRRPGAWTPIEAQGMVMNLPAPVGTAPVELATVESGGIESTVRYTGQAVGYVEQDVTPRVTGVITWMPFYAGDHVKRGQLLARQDTTQSAPQVASQKGQVSVAQQGVGVAHMDYQQALAMVNEAHAEVGTKQGAIEAARADVTAAEQERANTQANLDAAQSMTSDANAQLQAAQADQQYWQNEISREAALLKAGAVTQEEYQREKAQAQNADAKVRQAQARITQVEAQIRATQSGVQKADAGIVSAKSKLVQAQSDLHAHEAHVRSARAAADSARQKIAQAEARVQQARGMLESANATQGYSEIRSQIDGVITQRVISPGVLVSPGQTLLRVAQISPIRLQANVAESDLQKIRVGRHVLINDPNGNRASLSARITSIAPSIDPMARTGIVEALLPNTDGRFLPGQYVTMDISVGRSENALQIPMRAIRYHTPPSGNALSSRSTPTVWIAEPIPGQDIQFTVHEAVVKTGRSNEKYTEILSGVKPGQKVVTAGQDYLKDGDSVNWINSPAAPASLMSQSPDHDTVQTMPGRHNTMRPASSTSPVLYICPMHPEVVQDHPGTCPKCGMTLVVKRTGGSR